MKLTVSQLSERKRNRKETFPVPATRTYYSSVCAVFVTCT